MESVHRGSAFGVPVLWIVLASALTLALLAVSGQVSAMVALVGCLPLALAIAIGVIFPASGVFGTAVMGARTGRGEVALTFDDGPDPRWTPALLDLLDARQQRATFFVIGHRAEHESELLRDMVRRGHEIANHSWSHSFLTAFRHPHVLARELERTNALIVSATGVRPRWFRPPVGLTSPRIFLGTRLAKLELVFWTASARDGISRTTVASALSRLETALTPGAILVLHDARLGAHRDDDREPIARAVLTRLLDRMDEVGLRSVTLSELCAAIP